MAPTYVQPTQAEMEATLKAPEVFQRASNPVSGGEILYDWKVRKGAAVRVCSSIVPGYGGREVGQDAIRVLVVHPESGHIFWAATRVHRTQNWAKNMMNRVKEAWDFIKGMKKCEMCSSALHSAVSKAGNPYNKCVDVDCTSKTEKPFRRGV